MAFEGLDKTIDSFEETLDIDEGYLEGIPGQFEFSKELPDDRWRIFGLQGKLQRYERKLAEAAQGGKEPQLAHLYKRALLSDLLRFGEVFPKRVAAEIASKRKSLVKSDFSRACLFIQTLATLQKQRKIPVNEKELRKFQDSGENLIATEEAIIDPDPEVIGYPKTTQQLNKLYEAAKRYRLEMAQIDAENEEEHAKIARDYALRLEAIESILKYGSISLAEILSNLGKNETEASAQAVDIFNEIKEIVAG